MAACAVLAAMAASPASAQGPEQYDIAAFRVTDLSGGRLSIRYRLDDWHYDNTGNVTFVSTPTWEEELSLQARGYVYHPALLDWTVGGGPLLVQYGYDSDQGDSSGSEVLFNFNAKLGFLARTPYPFSLYYRRNHPSITTGLSGRFLAQTDEYGIQGQLKKSVSPLAIGWEAAHWESYGSGFGTTVDENMDRASLQTGFSYAASHNLRLNLDWNERNSRSGAPGLPVQESTVTNTSVNLSDDGKLGDEDQGALRQNLFWLSQITELATRTELETLGYTGNLSWEHSDATRSFTNLQYTDTDRTESYRRSGEFRAGATHDFTDAVYATGEAGYKRDEAPGFAEDQTGAKVATGYSRPLPFGRVGLYAYVEARRTNRQAEVDRITVFDESVVLTGTVPVPLSRDFVIVESVVVTNVPQTQTFTEGVDYRLLATGGTTTIERLITGSIDDGQTVLVTYDVLTGGTVKYDTLGEGFALSLGLFRHSNLFFNFYNVEHRIQGGINTVPFNDVTRMEFGGRVDYPIHKRWTVGGEYRYRDQQEDISPYSGHRLNTYVQVGLPLNSSLRVDFIRERAVFENSPEDIDLTRYAIGLNTRLWGGVVLGYNADYLEDDGGTVYREELRHALRLDWGYRLVRFTLRAEMADITQGDSRREYKRVTAEVTRSFN